MAIPIHGAGTLFYELFHFRRVARRPILEIGDDTALPIELRPASALDLFSLILELSDPIIRDQIIDPSVHRKVARDFSLRFLEPLLKLPALFLFGIPSLNRFVFDTAAPDHPCQCARVLDVRLRRLNEVFDVEESEAARMSLIERIRGGGRQLIGAAALLLPVIFAGSGVEDRDLIIEPRMNARPRGAAFIRGSLFSAAHADDFQPDFFLRVSYLPSCSRLYERAADSSL